MTQGPDEKSRGIPWGWVLRIGGVVCGLLLVYWLVDTDKLWQQVSQISAGIVVLALVINYARFALIGLRWRLMNTESSAHSVWQYVLFTWVSAPAQLFLPGVVGMDLARGVLLGQSAEQNRAEHLVSVLSDRVIGLFSVLMLGSLGVFIAPKFPGRWHYLAFLGLLMLGFVFAILIAASSWLYKILARIFGALGSVGEKGIFLLDLWQKIVLFYRQQLGRVFWALMCCFAIHLSWFFIVYLLVLNLKIDISFFIIMTITAISWVVIALPISWMGLGVNELTFIYLLSFQGVAKEAAVALSLHQAAINILFAIACIPFWLFITNKAKAQAKAQAAAEAAQETEGAQETQESEAAEESKSAS